MMRRTVLSLLIPAAVSAATVAGSVPTGASTAGTSSRPATTRLPAQLLNLADWKLTLPSGPSHHPTEVTQPSLGTFSNGNFSATKHGAGISFLAYADGTTTSGSSYPRSELREMTDGGRSEAAWSDAVGVNTMTVTESVVHLPAAKPQVVIAQIHDDSDDVIEIMADAMGSHHNADGSFGICVRNGDPELPTCLDDHYRLKQKVTITLVATGGKVAIYYNGALKMTLAEKTAAKDYFKVGCYPQENPSTKGYRSSDYGHTALWALSVTHTS